MFNLHASAGRILKTTTAIGCIALMMTAKADIAPYSQDFEGLVDTDPGALTAAGWGVFGNVFEAGTGDYLYGYGPFGAPNDGSGFSGIVVGEGGAAQGAQQLVVYNDYGNDGEHTAGNLVEANVFRQLEVGAADVGKTWVFTYDAKRGDIGGATTALAFIKTIQPGTFFLIDFITNDTTSLPTTWGTYSLSITLDAGHVGYIFQYGFASTATSFEPSGNLYDNIELAEAIVDTDGDGVGDSSDNCTLVANADQRDTNGDGYGNICDPDTNNDGVVNFGDIQPWTALFNTPCGDVDEDFDGDGFCNFLDYQKFPVFFLQPPGPSGVAP